MKTTYIKELNTDEIFTILRNYLNVPEASITMELISDEDIVAPWEIKVIITEEIERPL